MRLSLKPKSEEERQAAWNGSNKPARRLLPDLAENLAKDGISVEEFLANALADGYCLLSPIRAFS